LVSTELPLGEKTWFLAERKRFGDYRGAAYQLISGNLNVYVYCGSAAVSWSVVNQWDRLSRT
jgi:hypothetical protein